MEPQISTTPFGRRPLKFVHVANQSAANERSPQKSAHQWHMFRSIRSVRARFSVQERALAVLDAPLTFHPEIVLIGGDLVVFPSNRQLSLRTHGMAPATLRRHRAGLVDAGLIVRRDSPNGKRDARKDGTGEIDEALGFDISPLAARADELEALAEAAQAEERGLKHVWERITICRRDIAKMIATGIEEGLPTPGAVHGLANWLAARDFLRDMIARIPRTRAGRVRTGGQRIGEVIRRVGQLFEKSRKSSRELFAKAFAAWSMLGSIQTPGKRNVHSYRASTIVFTRPSADVDCEFASI